MAGGLLVTLLAVEAAVIECFLVPLRVGRVAVPLAALLAVAGNLLLPRMIVAVAGRRSTGLLPPVLWLLAVLIFAAPRSEGDLIVPGSWPGLVFLFLGAIAGAFGAAIAVMGGSWRSAGPGRLPPPHPQAPPVPPAEARRSAAAKPVRTGGAGKGTPRG